jgi:hypothetical protein
MRLYVRERSSSISSSSSNSSSNSSSSSSYQRPDTAWLDAEEQQPQQRKRRSVKACHREVYWGLLPGAGAARGYLRQEGRT